MTWRNIVLAIVGVWFFVSAWALNPMHSSAYVTSAIIFGLLILIASIWGLFVPGSMVWRYYLTALFGLYMGLTPFFYSFTHFGTALWITMLAGLIALIGGIWQAVVGPKISGSPEHRHHAA
jgi:thiol:disulfide interchange protein